MGLAAVLIASITLLVLVSPELATATIGAATNRALSILGTPVLWLSTAILLLIIFLAASPYGTELHSGLGKYRRVLGADQTDRRMP